MPLVQSILENMCSRHGVFMRFKPFEILTLASSLTFAVKRDQLICASLEAD